MQCLQIFEQVAHNLKCDAYEASYFERHTHKAGLALT